MRAWKIGIGATMVIVAAAAGTYISMRYQSALVGGAGAAAPGHAGPAMPVPVTPVVKKTIPVYLTYSARMDSIRSIALQAKVAGYLLDQVAADGADVKQGDLLYRIDPRDYQAALDQAKAQMQRDTASLDYAKTSFSRGSDLVKSGSLSKDVYDQRVSAMQQGEAAVAADRAAIQSAEINLGYTEIRAPFAGRMGRNQAPIGTLVTLGGTTLNTLVQISPIYVTFTPSETDLALIQKARKAGTVAVEVTVPGDASLVYKGDLTFIDNTIDRSTGTIVARATIANEDRALLPGQYVTVRLLLGEKPDTLLVPQVALGSGQLGKFVYVIDDGNKVGMRLVELGQTDGELVAIAKGIKENDRVITGNLQKIGPGMPVTPTPSARASASEQARN